MAGSVRRRLSLSAAALRDVLANRDIRRLQLADAGSILGTWAYSIALLVYAYDVGGAGAVGVVALVRYLPSALASPFSGLLADRHPRLAVMLASDLVRAAAMAAAAATIAVDGPPALVFALVTLTSVASTAFKPAKSALLPSLARTPEELTAANVASSTIESVGVFAGPALGAGLLAVTAPEVVFAANGATFVWSAFLVAQVRRGRREPERPGSPRRAGAIARSLAAGFGTVAREPAVRLVALLTAAQTFVFGALTVFVVVLALDLLALGEAGVGLLNSALGVGGLVGSVAAFALVGKPRLGAALAAGIAAWGLPLALVAAWPQAALALVLFGVIGLANTLVDVAGLTLLQRSADDAILARVFAALRTLVYASVALGGAVAPLLISALGARAALAVAGGLLPVLAAVAWRPLRRLDALAARRPRELALLQRLPLFAPLPAQTLERLAAGVRQLHLPAGATVFREGEAGDDFYVVARGRVDVSVDGSRVAALAPGDCFGEIALLRDVPRTATVAAATDVELLALTRAEFLAAIAGAPESASAADALVAERLAGVPRLGTA